MRNPDRIDPMVELLRTVWAQHPDLRLGQLVHAAASMVGGEGGLFFLEDDLMESGLEHLRHDD